MGWGPGVWPYAWSPSSTSTASGCPTSSFSAARGGGLHLAQETLDRARPCAAAQAVGAAQGALDLALVYASRRRQFGRPIAGLQLVQEMLADMAIKTEAARWLTYAAAASVDAAGLEPEPWPERDPHRPSPRRIAAVAKCSATDAAMEVATDAVQVFGGYGYMED